MNRLLPALAFVCVLVPSPRGYALTEAQLLGTWELTSYLAIRETAEGSYHLVIDGDQRSEEYALILQIRFQRNAACVLTLSLPAGGTEEVAARFQKQTVEGREYVRLRFGAEDEVTLTLRQIVPEEVSTLFFLSTARGQGAFSGYYYDTFGSMEKLAGS